MPGKAQEKTSTFDEWINGALLEGSVVYRAKKDSAGKRLLNFLSWNQATISNTWFANKDYPKYTWQHPRTKQRH